MICPLCKSGEIRKPDLMCTWCGQNYFIAYSRNKKYPYFKPTNENVYVLFQPAAEYHVS
jgi:hypothetical protein